MYSTAAFWAICEIIGGVGCFLVRGGEGGRERGRRRGAWKVGGVKHELTFELVGLVSSPDRHCGA